jgi:lysophospholipase L1-like esterase
MAHYKDEALIRGWGQFLQPHFKDGVSVVNCAVGGRSSKSFRAEGRWRAVLEDRPEFVLIQFGHNDARLDWPGAAAPDGEYRECLIHYVTTARESGITPILVTPVHMLTFDHSGEPSDPLCDYAATARGVAAEMNVQLVDLHASSGELFAELGRERSAALASGPSDFVHFNARGANVVAELVASELRRAEPRLASHLWGWTAALSKPNENQR